MAIPELAEMNIHSAPPSLAFWDSDSDREDWQERPAVKMQDQRTKMNMVTYHIATLQSTRDRSSPVR